MHQTGADDAAVRGLRILTDAGHIYYKYTSPDGARHPCRRAGASKYLGNRPGIQFSRQACKNVRRLPQRCAQGPHASAFLHSLQPHHQPIDKWRHPEEIVVQKNSW